MPVFQPADEVVVVLILPGDSAFFNRLYRTRFETVLVIKDFNSGRDRELARELNMGRARNTVPFSEPVSYGVVIASIVVIDIEVDLRRRRQQQSCIEQVPYT